MYCSIWIWIITSQSLSAYTRRERAGNALFVPGGVSLPEAIHCLCAHITFFKWFQSMIVFRKNEFLNDSDLHCKVLKHLLFLVTCLSMILWVSQSLNYLDLIWRLPRTGVKKSWVCSAGTNPSTNLKKNTKRLAFLLSRSG